MKKALLVVSFGTSVKETVSKTIIPTEEKLKSNHEDRDFFRCYTSPRIIAKLRKRGESIDNFEEALIKIADGGYEDILVQTTFLLEAIEYEKIVKTLDEYRDRFKKVFLGRALLGGEKNIMSVANAIDLDIRDVLKSKPTVFMGHGTDHAEDVVYEKVESALRELSNSVYVGSVEGERNIDDIIKELKNDGVTKVNLVPFMLVCGLHVKEDMIGEDEDSWKNSLNRNGIETDEVLIGMGELESIQDIIVNNSKGL